MKKLVTSECTAESPIWGAEAPKPIGTKFCMLGAVHDVVTPVIFCDDRWWGFAWQVVEFWPFPFT